MWFHVWCGSVSVLTHCYICIGVVNMVATSLYLTATKRHYSTVMTYEQHNAGVVVVGEWCYTCMWC